MFLCIYQCIRNDTLHSNYWSYRANYIHETIWLVICDTQSSSYIWFFYDSILKRIMVVDPVSFLLWPYVCVYVVCTIISAPTYVPTVWGTLGRGRFMLVNKSHGNIFFTPFSCEVACCCLCAWPSFIVSPQYHDRTFNARSSWLLVLHHHICPLISVILLM